MVWLLLLVLVVCLVLSGSEYAYIVGAVAVGLFLVTGHGSFYAVIGHGVGRYERRRPTNRRFVSVIPS